MITGNRHRSFIIVALAALDIISLKFHALGAADLDGFLPERLSVELSCLSCYPRIRATHAMIIPIPQIRPASLIRPREIFYLASRGKLLL